MLEVKVDEVGMLVIVWEKEACWSRVQGGGCWLALVGGIVAGGSVVSSSCGGRWVGDWM